MKPIAALLLLAASLPVVAGDFNYAAYEPVVLDQLVATIEVDPRVDYYFDLALPRYQSTAVFTGRSRAISQSEKYFIASWIKVAQLPPTYYDMFQSEVEIQQGASVYWMPIQEVLLKPFGKEIIAGSKVRLYAMLLGEFKHVPVFAISEFNASEG